MEKKIDCLSRIWLLQSLLDHALLSLWPSPFRSYVPESCWVPKSHSEGWRAYTYLNVMNLLSSCWLSRSAFINKYLSTASNQVSVLGRGNNEKTYGPALEKLRIRDEWEQTSQLVTRVQHEEVSKEAGRGHRNRRETPDPKNPSSANQNSSPHHTFFTDGEDSHMHFWSWCCRGPPETLESLPAPLGN